MEHLKSALDQTIGIHLSRGASDHPPMEEVGGGRWLRRKLATLTYLHFLTYPS